LRSPTDRLRIPIPVLVLFSLVAAPNPTRAQPTQDDIDALERDLQYLEPGDRRDELLSMLMEGLAERCFPDESKDANPVVRDEWSRTCLGRAVEVAEEILARPGHAHGDRALFVAGKASVALRRPAAGMEFLERFVVEYPAAEEAPLAHYSLAESAWDEDGFEEAIPHYRAAIQGLPPERSALPTYRLAWSLHRTGDTAEALGVLADLLDGELELEAEVRDTAVADVEALALALGDPTVTLDVIGRVHGEAAPSVASSVAGALMGDGRTGRAGEHYAAMIERWPTHVEAASWQVGRIDGAWATDDRSGVRGELSRLMIGFGPGSPYAEARGSGAEDRRAMLQVEETSRSGVARLHQLHRDGGDPGAPELEALYRGYLDVFPGAERAAEVRMALASLLHEEGRGAQAVDEMLGVVEAFAGRERGAQAARVAAEAIAGLLPERVSPGALDPAEERMVRLAELFASGYPRHPDGAGYLYEAGERLLQRGQRDRGEELLWDVARRYPTEPRARSAAAALVQSRLEVEDWGETAAMAAELLALDELVAAHPDLAQVLGQGKATARFNAALQLSEAGDPAAAAAEFEAVAADREAGDLQTRALYYAGVCLADSGNVSKAGVTFRRMYTRFPDAELAPEARQQEAQLRWQREDYTGAAALYRALADAYPHHELAADALYTASALYDQEGLFDEAIAGYRAYLEGYPEGLEAGAVHVRLSELDP